MKKHARKISFNVLYIENGKIKFREPKFKIGNKVRYIKTTEDTIREVHSISYIEGMQEFVYWISGIGHDVSEDELIRGRVRKKKEYSMNFISAQLMKKEHPETFDAPTIEELTNLKESSIVKICHKNERFWTIIKKIDKDKDTVFQDLITAVVNNKLIEDQPFDLGDIIQFQKHHIYSIS